MQTPAFNAPYCFPKSITPISTYSNTTYTYKVPKSRLKRFVLPPKNLILPPLRRRTRPITRRHRNLRLFQNMLLTFRIDVSNRGINDLMKSIQIDIRALRIRESVTCRNGRRIAGAARATEYREERAQGGK
jgi:hypothetical protein